jgi:hypothetical protein
MVAAAGVKDVAGFPSVLHGAAKYEDEGIGEEVMIKDKACSTEARCLRET